ncbi:hypothetical protein GCM10010912_59880 [Paenibacillus albidus]|uniref:Uncharacterized protein n=1 Tax=Paenibacillus albidus TaxID=2041023 RepID=A0A917D1B9_9BACL|nr:hypothetical protein GCM10010912_59880 [Paenibacillus albidus]
MVGAQHKADDDNNKPLEGGLSRETSAKWKEKFIHVFEHRYVQSPANRVNCLL